MTPPLGWAIIDILVKAHRHDDALGRTALSHGEAAQGGVYAKTGTAAITGLLKPGDVPPEGGLYLLDMVPDGDVQFGHPVSNDAEAIGELIACGAHVVLYGTGQGSVVGAAIAPVIKVCSNPETFERLWDDMDIDAGRILQGEASLEDVAKEIRNMVMGVAQGTLTNSEDLGHQEFHMTYKRFEPLGPDCLPL